MTQDSDARLEELIEEVLLQEDGGRERLEKLCAAHPTLAEGLRERARILSGLRAHLRTGGMDQVEAHPRQVGRFRVLEVLGRGGMGVVYRARDTESGGEVALKVVHFGWLDPERQRARFLREVRVAGRLQHPSLLPVLDAGVEGDRAYFATDLVDGLSLKDLLRAFAERVATAAELSEDSWIQVGGSAPSHERDGSPGSGPAPDGHAAVCARIGLEVARALVHAHSHGVFHRDVKPGNVMLARDGRVLLVDFGLAQVASEATLTGTGDFLGTPYYVPPERIESEAEVEDSYGDVWGLGVCLYELLTLSKPFAGRTREQVFRQILEENPVPLRRLNPEVPIALETVVLEALEKRPRQRYPSAAALAEDLERFLAGRRVRARRKSSVELAGQWARREPLKAGLMAALGLSILVMGIGSLVYGARLHDAAEELREREARASWNLYRADMAAATQALERGDWHTIERLLTAQSPELRGFEWHHLWTRGHTGVEFLSSPEPLLRRLAMSPDGAHLATGHSTGTVLLWNLPRRLPVRELARHEGRVESLAFSPDGRWLASAGEDRAVLVSDLADPGTITSLGPLVETLSAVSFSPAGAYLAASASNWVSELGEVRVWSTVDWEPVGRPLGLPKASAIHFAAEEQLLVAFLDGRILRWSFTEDAEPEPFAAHRVALYGLDGSGSSSLFSLARTRDGISEISAWDTVRGEVVARDTRHGAFGLEVGPGGEWLAVGRIGGVTLHDPSTLEIRRFLEGDSGGVNSLAFARDGMTLLTAAEAGRIGLWDLGTLRVVPELPFGLAKSVALDATGRHLAGGSNVGDLRVWDLTTGRSLFSRRPGGGNALVCLSADGRTLWSGLASPASLVAWDVERGSQRWTAPLEGVRGDLRLAPGGDEIAISSIDAATGLATILVLASATGDVLRRLELPPAPVHCLAYANDGTLAAADIARGRLWLFDPGSTSAKEIAELTGTPLSGIAFASQRRWLACSTPEQVVVLDLEQASVVASLPMSPGPTSLVSLDDDRRLVVCSRKGQVRFVDTQRWEEAVLFEAHRDYLEALAVSGDGSTIATGDFAGRIRIWRR